MNSEHQHTEERIRCGNSTCLCTLPEGHLFCSEYCAEAATHGIERNYCQCEHECTGSQLAVTPVFSYRDEFPDQQAQASQASA